MCDQHRCCNGGSCENLSVAMQAAAHEAKLGHGAIAQQLRDLIDEAKRRSAAAQSRPGASSSGWRNL
jgi:hypothetical protein